MQWEERTIRIEGTGAVGYKVYDAQGKLVMVANRHAFTIPAQLDLSQIKICVAGGDGGEVEIYKDGKILPAYDKPLSFDNPVGLTVSTGTKILSVSTSFATIACSMASITMLMSNRVLGQPSRSRRIHLCRR